MRSGRVVEQLRTRFRRLAWSWCPPSRDRVPVAGIEGPDWFRTLAGDDLVVSRAPSTDVVRISWAFDGPDVVSINSPFVSPARSHPGSRRRLPRSTPLELRLLDAAARRRLPVLGADPDQWVTEAHARHVAGRDARATTLLTTVGHGLEMVETPVVEIVCVSIRSALVPDVIELVDAQTYPHRSLRVLLTDPDVTATTLKRLQTSHPDVRFDARPGVTLGECLNEALDTSDADLMAKWDDDDWYGPHYLADLVREHVSTRAAVVGKHSYFAYLERSDRTVLRFPNRCHQDVTFLAGGTLLIDRTGVSTARFPDVNLGEDQGFLAGCAGLGLRIRATDPFNYLQVRGMSNTWGMPDALFLRDCTLIGSGRRLADVGV